MSVAPVGNPTLGGYGAWASGAMGASQGNSLPRSWLDFLSGGMGPLAPISPIGIDVPDSQSGRPAPRRMEYPVGWNLPTGVPGSEGLKLVSFANLRAYADMYSVARACISLRKEEVLGLDWDIVPTTTAQRNLRGDPGANQDFQDRRDEVLAFFKRPDPNYHDFQGWLGALLEDVFVVDACSLYVHPTRKKGSGLLGSDLGALEVLDGTTIRPLLDVRGGTPRPPNPAYQQYLWGVPRTDLMDIILDADIAEMDEPVAEYRADQLLYLPYTRRTWTPYGFPGIERSIIPVMTGLKKQQFALEFFTEGSIPGQFVIPGDDISTPTQIRQLQETLNALAGDQAWKHKIIVLPRGSDTKPQKPVELADQFDEVVQNMVCQAFEVMPMELGILPKVSATASPGAAGQAAKESSTINQRKALKPLLSWLKTAIFDHVLQDICGQDDMQFVWVGMEQGEDAETQANNFKTLTGVGLMSIDECRVQMGLAPWGLPLTSDPIYMSATGVSTLGTIDPAIADSDLGVPEINPAAASTQPTSIGPAPAPGTTGATPPGPQTQAGTPGIGGRPAGGGGGPPAVTPPAAGTSTPLHGTASKAAAKAAADEMEALRRYLKKGRNISDWKAEFLPPAALEAVHKAIAAGDDSATAIAKGRKVMKSAARLSRRDDVMTGAAASVVSALGHLAGQINNPTVGPIQFIDQGTQVLQQGYQNVYQAAAQDASADYSNVSPVVPGGFAALAATRAENQRGFLTGMAQDIMGNASPAQVAQRINLYAASLQPAYEEGYGLAVTSGQALGNGNADDMDDDEDFDDDDDDDDDIEADDTVDTDSGDGSTGASVLADLAGAAAGFVLGGLFNDDGSVDSSNGGTGDSDSDSSDFSAPPRSKIIWHATSDDPCDLCAERDGQEFTLDTLPGWPGDGGFGELCEGAGNCHCYLEYQDADDSSTAGNPLSDLTTPFYTQRAAEEDQLDADAVSARQADIDYVATQSQDAADRMAARDAAMGVPGTRTGPGGRYDVNAAAEPDLTKGAGKLIRKLVTEVFNGQYPPSTWDWINDAKWSYDDAVPLDKVNGTRDPATFNKQTLSSDVARIKQGRPVPPLVLVEKDDGTYDLADGNHRATALEQVGRTATPAFIADMGSDPQPDLEAMQDSKLYKINREVDALHKAADAAPLISWYNEGADGAISWGSPGDYDACVSIAGKYMPDDQTHAFCALRHHDATGAWPGHAAGEDGKAVTPTVVKSLPADILAEAEVGDRLVDDEIGKTYVIKSIDGDEVTLEEL